ncbi:MAG: copper-translocating P-type ATPase [Actinomycetota bacterium]|nr:copper-translocating P-type ATPase [Actinomycetota bacterium]
MAQTDRDTAARHDRSERNGMHEHSSHDHAVDRHDPHGDDALAAQLPEREGASAEHDEGHDTHGGHGDHAHHDPAQFRNRFWVTLALSIPVVFFSEMFQELIGYSAPSFPASTWIAPVLGTIVFVYGGWPFLVGAVQEVRTRRPGMMLLIGLAISVAFAASIATELGAFELDFWWELAALIAIMLLGHWQEMKAIGQAGNALAALAELLPDDAERVTDAGVETVAISELRPGDVVLVRSGARIPADGEVVDGSADVDESMLTGESRPVAKTKGDSVTAGTVATDSALRVRVDAIGENTALAGIQRLVREAQSSRSRAQALADRAAAFLFYVATAAGLITFLAWTVVGEPRSAIERTVTVLVIACPHALGLAIPLVISISTALSARNGILVKDRLALERMRDVDVVLFDKTGTLTAAEHVVTGTAATDGDADRALALAAAVESDSEHPLARAIVAAAKEKGGVPAAEAFRSMTARGVEAVVEGRRLAVGGPNLMQDRNAEIPASLRGEIGAWEGRGASVLFLLDGVKVLAAFSLEDRVREESRDAVAALHAHGIKVAMITGDAEQVAAAVAAELDIDEYFAEVLPEDKDAAVADLQRRGHRVAMVGDGVNDAPALARADVGIAIGAGTDVAIESAGVILASDDPRAVVSVIKLSKASYRKMVQNLVWATGYNTVAIPLAAGVLAWAGISLSPAIGAVLMSVSTIVVALNAQLLRRQELRPAPAA